VTNDRCGLDVTAASIRRPAGASRSQESSPISFRPGARGAGATERVEGDARGGEELVWGGGRAAAGRSPLLVAAAHPGGQVRWLSLQGTSAFGCRFVAFGAAASLENRGLSARIGREGVVSAQFYRAQAHKDLG
jgi:hypothetical protein